MADTSENGGLELVSGRGALRIQVSGIDDEDIAKLLQDTAQFVRMQAADIIADTPRNENIELMFKRVDVGDFVIVTIKRR